MNFADIARQLAHGELSQIAVGEQILDNPTEKLVQQLADSVNLALTSIYKRFLLKQGQISLSLFPAVDLYPLRDTAVLKIETVSTLEGVPLPLNDASNPLSCTTPSARTLKIPKEMAYQSAELPLSFHTTGLRVGFRANHPVIDGQEAFTNGMDSIDIELPPAYLQALLYFVGSRYHNPRGMTGEFNAGNSFFAKYENECKRLELENLQTDQGGSNTRLQRGGWV